MIYVRFFTVWSPGEVGNHLRRRGKGRKQGLNSSAEKHDELVMNMVLNGLHVFRGIDTVFPPKSKSNEIAHELLISSASGGRGHVMLAE